MKKIAIIGALALGAFLIFNKVSGKSGAETAEDLPGITFAASVPLYPGTEFVSEGGGEYSQTAGEWARYEAWTLTLPDSKAKVVAFYDSKLTGAERDANDDYVTYTLKHGDKERTEVRVREDSVELFEFRKPRF